ncbi:MAG: aminopeptidase P family protein [Rhodospirillaceae bacterium]|jgi:Xaa-Pro dipeptidase|nr:aminopeptidase P family protein [Rhodospirillaceae bacterium]MBT5895181.1 aminopeptidase P family protein [Rhodospirillaceae bacterium]MBT7757815.1 aminopeptidase P family protein [Rhodospirillaceae bacterium]
MNTDRPPPQRGFPEAEFARRLERAQDFMGRATMDALLFTTPEDIRYFSGFLTQFFQSPTRPWFLIVPKAGKPVAVIPTIGEVAMSRTWIEDIRTWSSPHPTDDGISLLAGTLAEFGHRIGLPMGREAALRMPLNDFARLRQRLDGAEFVDASPIIQALRLVKSELEIEKIAYACAAVGDAFDAAPELFSVGQSDVEAFRRFKIECLEQGVDDVSYLVGGAGAGGYGDIISPPSGRAIQTGDVLILDTGCTYDGYFCDFDRNFAFDNASDHVRRAYDTVYRATTAGLAAARPGASCADLFHAMQGVMAADGALGNDVGRLGHGLGLQLTEGPSNTPFDETELQPGMVMTLEPGMSFAPGKVMVHEENIVIRDGEPQLLSRRAAPELPVIG